MNWEEHFADRTTLMQLSTVREFLKHASQPGMISFAGGLPDPDLLPVKETRAAVERALTIHGARALQYGVTEGIAELREVIATKFQAVGATAENVLITTGSQQALDLIGRVLLNEGSRVAVQNPTYLAALSAWRAYGTTFVPGENRSPLMKRGMPDVDLIYCIPNFVNPTGESLNLCEREELVSYSIGQGFPLVEDDPYGDLRYTEEPKPPSLLEIAGNLNTPILHVGTISKVLAPGFRIGWIVADRNLIAKLAVAKQSLDLHTSTFVQYTVLELLKTDIIENSLPRLCAAYGNKRNALASDLEARQPKLCSWTHPQGGFFLLLTLPSAIDGAELARRALRVGLVVVPGVDFHVRGGRNTLRISFSNASRVQITEGVSRLTGLIEHYYRYPRIPTLNAGDLPRGAHRLILSLEPGKGCARREYKRKRPLSSSTGACASSNRSPAIARGQAARLLRSAYYWRQRRLSASSLETLNDS